MRHAKSDWSNALQNDFDRPLNARGEKDAETMGRFMFKQGLMPDLIISSPAVRASKTTQHIVAKIKKEPSDIIYEPKLYMGVPGETIKLIDEALLKSNSLLIVSHNPLVEQLVSVFWQDDPLPYTDTHKLVTTGNLIIFELENDSNSSVSEKIVLSKKLFRPKELQEI